MDQQLIENEIEFLQSVYGFSYEARDYVYKLLERRMSEEETDDK